jgi:hypothetical protein
MLIKIFNFFGYDRQLRKASEELSEVKFAFQEYVNESSKENIENVLEEINDLKNVIEGIALVKYGVNLTESEKIKESKKVRTCDIIDMCDGNPENYEVIRYRE